MNVHLIENIFSNDKRRKLIEYSKPLLLENSILWSKYPGRKYPGRQSAPNIHLLLNFKSSAEFIINSVNRRTGLNLGIEKSWVNWTNGKKEDIAWHSHECDYSLVYYMKTVPFFSDGTLFRDQFVKAPVNSLLLFPGYLEHTAPSCPFRIHRYTWAFELNKQ